MNNLSTQIHKGFIEFIIVLALCMSLVALSIDTMLPALPDIVQSFGVEQPNSQQFIIILFFIGLSVGQLIAGPLSDTIGRKKGIYIGLLIFAVGCAFSYFAQNFTVMLIGRFLQGVGAAGPRIITIAMVRDCYKGAEMARVMSYIMGIFVLVPALAPAIGQGIILVSGWHAIFFVFVLMALVIFIWLSKRLPETLHVQDKRPFTFSAIWSGLKIVFSTPITFYYMIVSGFIFGAFMGYLNSSQQIFQDYYILGKYFPIYFGLVAVSVGASFFINARLVRKLGMHFIVFWSLVALVVISSIFLLLEFFLYDYVPLFSFMAYIMLTAFFVGMLFGNLNAIAMEPMGHIAGIASAVIGCVSLVISIITGSSIGQLYNETLIPITGGFLILSFASLLIVMRGNNLRKI